MAEDHLSNSQPLHQIFYSVHLDKLYCAGVTDKGVIFADACKPKELCPTFGKGMQAVIYFPYQQSFVNVTHAHCTYIHKISSNFTCFPAWPRWRISETIRWRTFICWFLWRIRMQAQIPITAELLGLYVRLVFCGRFDGLSRLFTSMHFFRSVCRVGALFSSSSTTPSHENVLKVSAELARNSVVCFLLHMAVSSFCISLPRYSVMLVRIPLFFSDWRATDFKLLLAIPRPIVFSDLGRHLTFAGLPLPFSTTYII